MEEILRLYGKYVIAYDKYVDSNDKGKQWLKMSCDIILRQLNDLVFARFNDDASKDIMEILCRTSGYDGKISMARNLKEVFQYYY